MMAEFVNTDARFDGLETKANETLVSKRPIPGRDGQYAYRWRTREPHDYGDCLDAERGRGKAARRENRRGRTGGRRG